MGESAEELRESLAVLQRENEHLRRASAHANNLLNALQNLLDLTPDADPFSNVFDSLAHVFAYSEALILTEEHPTQLTCIAARPAFLKNLCWPNGTFFHKIANGRVIATFDNRDIPEWRDIAPDGHPLSPAQPALYLPVKVRKQRGVLILLRPMGDPGFSRHHVMLGRRFALLASHALAMRFEQELTQRAYYDSLTGLANHTLLQERVHTAIGRRHAELESAHFALAIIALNRFKQINDHYGHAVGDAILIQAAQRIKHLARPSDTLSRVGNDEFMLFFDPINNNFELHNTFRQILRDLHRPFLIDTHEIYLSGVLGASIFPDHGDSYKELRRNADNALHRARESTKDELVFFDPSIGSALTERILLEQQLRHAIRDNQLVCALQPKVNIRSGQVCGFEALVRWRDDSGTIRAPGDFIPLAIEIGLIDDITYFMLNMIIKSFAALDSHFGEYITVSLNVSARQASDNNFMTALTDVLLYSNNANRIILELTEEAFVNTQELVTHTMPLLQTLGTGISIDDFGCGYSSLSILANTSPNEIKIDRSFITQIDKHAKNQDILRTIEALSKNLGMQVVAEGVETPEELAYLSRHTNIDIAQGFYFAPPMFLDELETWQLSHQETIGQYLLPLTDQNQPYRHI